MNTICYLADASNPHTVKWCNYFKSKGFDVHVISLNSGKIDGIKVHNFSFNVKELKNESPFKKIKYITAVSEIKKLVNDIKPDILHAHYASSYGLIGSLLNYHPYIISVWGTDIYDFPNGGPIQKQIIKYNLKKADYIFSTSKDMARETGKYTNKKIYITPFGVDMNVFKPIKHTKKDVFTIGTIKTLEKKYGIDYLIKGFKLLKESMKDKNLQLKIGGSGSQEDNLKELVKELGLEDSVEFLGRISPNKVGETFNNFDVAVFPSLRESFGVAAVEAQACGIPVVVTNVGGHPEVVKDGVTGLIIDPQDPYMISYSLKILMDDKLRKSMSVEAPKFIKNNYEVSLNFKQIETIYINILEKR